MHKDLKKVINAAERQGWRVEQTKKGHFKFFAPDGVGLVISGGTPGDHRAMKNLISRLRKYGFRWSR